MRPPIVVNNTNIAFPLLIVNVIFVITVFSLILCVSTILVNKDDDQQTNTSLYLAQFSTFSGLLVNVSLSAGGTDRRDSRSVVL